MSRRSLRALQVEVTTRCTRRCAPCPRSALPDWREGDLSDEVWAGLEPALQVARHVHLQGWGEPLLHPGLRQMARAAKAAGCSVGVTTNGDLLQSAMDWLVEEGVDVVTVSVAGEPGTHARLRDGSSLAQVLTAVGQLSRRARRKRIQLSYLLTRDNADGLPALVERAAQAGVREVFVVHLDCTPTPGLLERAAFDDGGLAPGVADALQAASAAARRHRLRFRAPAVQREDLLTCALNPVRFAFVAWDGRVGPCVNLLLPVAGDIPRATSGEQLAVGPVCYGRLQDAGLREILAGPSRRGFIRSFERRLDAEQGFVGSIIAVRGAEALRQIEQADRERDEALAASPFPPACAGCHKACGW